MFQGGGAARHEWFEKLGCKEILKYVVVSARRHHIRFFPDAERRPQQTSSWYLWLRPSCTHPFEFDFYLCSRGYRTSDPLPVHPRRGCIHSLVFDFSLRSHVAIKGNRTPDSSPVHPQRGRVVGSGAPTHCSATNAVKGPLPSAVNNALSTCSSTQER